MKKVVLTLAGMIAASAFVPEASAIPAFARQTGMACSACHFQHFPVLSPFGQAFKASGFTITGAQGLIEGDHLSLPNTLNAAVLIKAQYVKTNDPTPAGEPAGLNTSSGQLRVPDELSLFFAGRVADNVGMWMENNLAAPGSALIAGLRIPFVFDLGEVKVSAIPYTTDSLGAAYGYEQGSTGLNRAIRWAEHRKDASAAQYVGLDGATAGFAFVAQNELGYINVSRWSPGFAYIADKVGASDTTAVQPGSNWVRLAATPTVADWALHVAVGAESGSSTSPTGLTYKTQATAADLQAQGKIGENETSVYLTYASVPANTYHNGGANAVSAVTAGIDYSVINHVLHIGGGIRNGKNNAAQSDNAVLLTAIYDMHQNVAFHLNYSTYSGDANSGAGALTNKLTLMLESAW
jgi:hypothetical protein